MGRFGHVHIYRHDGCDGILVCHSARHCLVARRAGEQVMSKSQLSSRDWFGKASAGLVLGFLLALAAGGLFKMLVGVGDAFFSTKGQIAMWLMSPVWALTLSFCFLFRTGLRAWVGLAIANVILWLPLFVFGGLAS